MAKKNAGNNPPEYERRLEHLNEQYSKQRATIRKRLIQYVNKELSGDEGIAPDDNEWYLYQPDSSYEIWKMVKMLDWQHLPFPGGLIDQPEWIMHDLLTLEWIYSVMKQQIQANNGDRQLGNR